MAGFDVGMLLGTQGVQLPDPVKQFATVQTLGDLARRGRMGALEEEETRRKLDASRAYEAGAPELIANQFSGESLVKFARENPAGAVVALKASQEYQKAKLEQAKSSAEVAKLLQEVRDKEDAMIGGIAQTLLNDPNTGPRQVQTLVRAIAATGRDPMAYGDWRQDVTGYLKMAVGRSIKADKQQELIGQAETRAETGRHNLATEANQAATLEETKANNAAGRNLQWATLKETQQHNRATEGAASLSQPFEVTVAGKPMLVQQDKRTGTLMDVNTRQPVSGNVSPKSADLPGSIVEKMAQNNVTISKIDRAIELARTRPESFGLSNYMGDTVRQRTDPEGVTARALVADIAGQKIHDRSGAAVTIGEMERLKPYIPNVTDDPATVAKKLELFRQEYAGIQNELAQGRSLAAMIVGGGGRSAGGAIDGGARSGGGRPTVRSDADYAALPSGTEFIAPDGNVRRKP